MIALRVTLSDASNVDFDDDEITDVKRIPWKKNKVQTSQKKSPYIFETGSEFVSFEVFIFHRYRDTQDKIESLIADQAEQTLYYAYAYDSTLSYSVILDPAEVGEYYVFEGREAGIITQLMYLQSS